MTRPPPASPVPSTLFPSSTLLRADRSLRHFGDGGRRGGAARGIVRGRLIDEAIIDTLGEKGAALFDVADILSGARQDDILFIFAKADRKSTRLNSSP